MAGPGYSFRAFRPTFPDVRRLRPTCVRWGVALAVGLALASAAVGRATEWERSSTEVLLESNGHSWVVKATINGRLTGRFLLDTGATFCVLAPQAAERLRLKAGDEKVTLRTANGTVQASRIELASVQVGSTRAVGVAAVVQPAVEPPLDGIIGLSFLNRFSYAIVPNRRVLRLQ
jgi:clan AA aspartic protease (TIGR02281 family)